MKKIILSVAVATMALSTAASALEDIKTTGLTKVWYETNNAGDNDFLGHQGSISDVTIRLDITGKQGNIGFGATAYSTSDMGLDDAQAVSTKRSGYPHMDNDVYFSQMYMTAPLGSDTLLKLGKQELNTPLAFTETWSSVNNSFDAAVVINNSFANTTIIGAYVGQTNGSATSSWGGEFYALAGHGATAAAVLYKNDMLSANVWYYDINTLAQALWIDASMNVGPAAVKAYYVDVNGENSADTRAFAASVATKVSSVSLMAAYSSVSDDGVFHVGNYATGGKKTKLPTMAVYTDGKYVAQMGSRAIKVKASGSVGGYAVALQHTDNSNDVNVELEAAETDLIVSKKFGDFNVKTILMNRTGSSTISTGTGSEDAQQHIRVVASVKF